MKILINKQCDPATNTTTILSSQVLSESDNIKYEIVENPPVINNKPGYIGLYCWNNETNSLDVTYEKLPVSVEDRIAYMQEVIDGLLMNGGI